MWPLYILLNKILKTQFVDTYESEQQSDHVKSKVSNSCRRHLIDVPHVNQLHSWDCGLACVLMVLRTVGINDLDIEALANLCATTSSMDVFSHSYPLHHTCSIWTVDLAYLLQQFSIRFSYYTVTFGANPHYCLESFYREHLPSDLLRVDMLFQQALKSGIQIECRSISREEISVLILSGKYIAIALVDYYKMTQENHLWPNDAQIPGVQVCNSGYTGHYVLICGYDTMEDEFEIRDPGCSRKHKRISSQCLEEARKAFGTDEDILVISLE